MAKAEHKEAIESGRWELLHHLQELIEKPMIGLSIIWVVLIILSFTSGLSRMLELVSYLIWGVFVLDFVLRFVIAPQKLPFLKSHWLVAVSLILPALRVFRIFQAFRLLWTAHVLRSITLVQVITSTNRAMATVRSVAGRRGIGSVLGVTAAVVFIGAAGMLQFEGQATLAKLGRPGQGLTSYGDALWFTLMILTTLGSEYWPQTAEGRLLCLMLAFYALGVLGYITATIASYFVGKDAETGGQNAPASSDDVAALRGEIAKLRTEVEKLTASQSLDRAA